MMGLVATISVLVLSQTAGADEKEPELVQAQKQKWDEFYRAEAASYTIMLEGDDPWISSTGT